MGDAEVQRIVEAFADRAVGVNADARVDALGADDHVAEIVLVEDAQVLFELLNHDANHVTVAVAGDGPHFFGAFGLVFSFDDSAFIHTDANGDAAFFARRDDAINLLAVVDVPGVQTDLVHAGFDGFQGPFKMKMHVGDDRNRRLFENRRKGGSVDFVGCGDAHNIAPGFCELANFGNGFVDFVSIGAGHRLDGDGVVTADGDRTDMDRSGFSSRLHGDFRLQFPASQRLYESYRGPRIEPPLEASKLDKRTIQPKCSQLPALLVAVIALAGNIANASQPATVALADGVRQLTDQLYDCRLDEGVSLRQSIKSSGIDLRLRQLVRVHVVTVPAAGQSHAIVQLAVSDMFNALTDTTLDADLKALLKPIEGRRFVALGIAMSVDTDGTVHPQGWETVSPVGMTMAIDIARDDARRQIDAAFAKHVATPDAESNKQLDAYRSTVASILPTMHPCQVCTISVPFEIGGIQYEAVGYGLPPWSEVRSWLDSSEPEAPGWVTQTLVATGKGATNTDGSNEQELAIARSTAQADALIKIATKVDELALPIEGGMTVGKWLKRARKYDALWSAFLHTAHQTRIEVASGICTVELTLELDRLWSLILAIDHAENTDSKLASPDVR